MNQLINQYNLRFLVRNYIGKYPAIFYRTYGIKKTNRELSVTQNTQLVIEGFPRSANTFAVLGFNYANPDIKVAHHLHIPAQVFLAAKWNIPTLVLLRNPKDAVASCVARYPGLSIDIALRNYISFYESV